MPNLKGHERGTELVKFSSNLRPKTKKLLEIYAYKNRLTMARALDEIIRKATRGPEDREGARLQERK
jgi:predicted metal-dependent RNase